MPRRARRAEAPPKEQRAARMVERRTFEAGKAVLSPELRRHLEALAYLAD